MEEWDTTDIAPRIQAPTAIIHGQTDLNVPVQAAYELQKLIPRASAPYIIPNAGHFLPITADGFVNAIIASMINSLQRAEGRIMYASAQIASLN